MKFPQHLLDENGRPKFGTKEMAEFLTSLHFPKDHPCYTAFGGRLVDGGIACPKCGQMFVQVGDSYHHPDSPSLEWALRNE